MKATNLVSVGTKDLPDDAHNLLPDVVLHKRSVLLKEVIEQEVEHLGSQGVGKEVLVPAVIVPLNCDER